MRKTWYCVFLGCGDLLSLASRALPLFLSALPGEPRKNLIQRQDQGALIARNVKLHDLKVHQSRAGRDKDCECSSISESHRTVLPRSSRQCGLRVVLMGSTIYGRHHTPSLIHIAGELVNSEDVNVTPTALCGSPHCRLETEFLRGPGHPWRSLEPRRFWFCSLSPLGARMAPSSRKSRTVDPTSDGSNRLRRLMSVGMTGATIARDCFAFRGSTMKKPDGAKNVLLVDHTEGQCRAIVGFKDKDSRSPYMCGEPVSRKPEEDNVMVRLSPRADARQRCRTKRSP